jgi:DNA-directed RNA polymerase specialized sigma24 family protein
MNPKKKTSNKSSKKRVPYQYRNHDLVKVTLPAVVTKRDPPYTALLVDREVDRAVCGTFVKMGWLQQDLCDGLQEVRLRAVQAFSKGKIPPGNVDEMGAYCARIARNYVIKLWKKQERAEEHGDAGLCEDADEFFPLPGTQEERDPVDAKRQLAVAKSLFDRDRMPSRGQAILEGVAWDIPLRKLGRELHLTERAIEGRLDTMRELFRREIEARGMGEFLVSLKPTRSST